jgi:hypoxanthine phosphoribosyltransferase
MLPDNYKLQYKSGEIADAVARLGKEIGIWVKEVQEETQREVIAMPILRGGIFFFADLARQVPVSMEVIPGRTRTYQKNVNAAQLDQVKIIIENEDLKNRSILLVDDICDSGKTLYALTKYMLEQGAKEIKSAVLIHRILEKEIYKPDWIGFDFKGDEWFVGYGMEDKNRWSNLPDIYTISNKV